VRHHVVAGAQDYWIDTEQARDTAAAIGGARFTVLAGVGHYPMEEIADLGAQMVGWLRELSGVVGQPDRSGP